jgi:3-hydroxybenzoate 6-monooxygenase
MAGKTDNARPVLIAGGGIGGLAAALALAATGRSSHVLEQSSRFGEIGAGIQLGPNVFRMFERMGLTEAVEAVAFFPESLIMRDSTTGEVVTSIPVGSAAFRARFKYPYAVIYRADLHALLLEACQRSPLVALTTSTRITGYRDDGDRVVVTTESGEEYEGAALIGADGLWSGVRAQIVNDGPPRVSGHIAYRAVLPIDAVPEAWRPNSVVLWGGAKHHFVHYPLRRGQIFNLVAVFHSDHYEAGWDAYGDPAELSERFKDAHPQVKGLLEKIEAWRMWVLCDREPVKQWSRGRVTLLGDAAHPMLQYLAQGACMAVEDAVVLADAVAAAGGDFEAAFESYQQARYLRTGRVQLTARYYGEAYHAGGVTAELRNMMLGNRKPDQAFEGLGWLYDGI